MSLIVQEPIKTIEGMLTKALAAESQLFYTFQRQDFSALQVVESNLDAGLIRVYLLESEGDQTSNFSIGDTIYLVDAGQYSGPQVIKSLNFTTWTLIYIEDTAFTGSYTTPFPLNNLTTRPNYQIQIQIYGTGVGLMFDTIFKYITNQAGFTIVDVGPLVRLFMKAPETFTFSQDYQLSYREVWEGSSETDTLSTNLQAILARKQLLQLGGANMWENLLRPTGVATDNSVGMFLTRFKNPKTWRGWNRSVSYIMDMEYQNRTAETVTRLYGEYLDINKNVINGGYITNDVDLTPRVIIVPFDPPVFTNIFYYGLKVVDNDNSKTLTERLDFEIKTECPQPIMLDWINSLGGVDQWLFTIAQSINDTIGEGILAEQPIAGDIEFITRTKQRFPGARKQQITLKAERLTGDQLDALHEIKQTESLRVYLSKDGTNFIDAVVVNEFSTKANNKWSNTENEVYDFSVTIEFPDNFSFFRGKLY